MNAIDPIITWRLIPPILPGRGYANETSGEIQMAIDSWLLDRHILGEIPPTLRFYTWSNPTISLGYHQRHYPAHWTTLTWQDKLIDLIKRPTGGRGVLHQGDLTYALIISGLVGNRSNVYQQICQFLIDGWRSLGVELDYGKAGKGYIHNPNCFGTATSADLVCQDGYKLIGSAQLIKSGAILQHGSMRLNPDLELFNRVFDESIDLPPMPIPELAHDRIIDALITAAQNHFRIQFAIEPLTDREWSQIMESIVK